MHFTRKTGFHFTSPVMWLNSPNGPSSVVQPMGKSSPSSTSSASAGTSRSTVRHFTSSTGAPCRRSEEHTSELQSQFHLVCRLLLEKKKWSFSLLRYSQYRQSTEISLARCL